MARGSTRKVQIGAAILTPLGSVMAAAGFYMGAQGEDPRLWFVASGACFVLAALLPIVFWWILPRIRGDESDEGTSITLENVSNVTIESNVPKEQIKEVNMKDVHNTNLRLNPSEEEGGTDQGGSETESCGGD